jgi:hypothetical protein
MTNFNSIVNSNILLNKIFLEVCIPKIFIDNGLSLITNIKKENDLLFPKNQSKVTHLKNSNNMQISNKDDYSELGVKSRSSLQAEIEKKNKIENPTLSTNNFNRKHTINTTGTNLNLKIENKNYDPPKHFNSKPSSPSNGLKNVFGMGYSFPELKSPEIRKNSNFNYFNFQPMDLSYINHGLQGLNNYGNTSTQNFQPGNVKKDENLKNGMNFRRFSESTSDKFTSNPLSNIMNSNLRSPQMPLKVNPDMFIPLINPMNMMHINGNQGLKTYQQKMQELNSVNSIPYNPLYNYDFLQSAHNSFLKNGFVSPRGITGQFMFPDVKKETHVKTKKNSKNGQQKYNQELLDFFLKKYDGLCNFMIFVKNCTVSFLKNLISEKKVVYY